METERLLGGSWLRFGNYGEKPKYTGYKELRNEIHTEGDNLIQG